MSWEWGIRSDTMITNVNGTTATQKFKDQLNKLIMEVFGFSFGTWHALDLWRDDYECFSIIEKETMLANVSVYRLKLLIEGNPIDCLQIGAVATKKEYRGQGLSRKIMEAIFSKYPAEPAFLFGNDSVVNFYPKFGFKPAQEYLPFLTQTIDNPTPMQRLTIKDPKVDKYLKGRAQFSSIFDCINQYSINWFHLLYEYCKDIIEIESLQVMVVAKQEGTTLRILDVVAHKPLTFEQILPFLGFSGVTKIEFGFNPDWLGVECQREEYREEDSTYFVKGDLNVNQEYIVPLLLHT